MVVLAGNRAGKTHVNIACLIANALGYYPWLVPGFKLIHTADGKVDFPPRSQIPSQYWTRRTDGLPTRLPAKVLFVSGLSLSRGVGEIAQDKWLQLWPREVEFKTYLATLGVWQKLRLNNGSEVYFGSAHQTGLAWEGFAADAVVLDEPIPKRIFIALRRGTIDQRAQIKWSLTPLGGAEIAWMAADLIRDEREDVHTIRGTSWQNPYLDKEALRLFLDDPSLSAAERRARESGEVMALGRRIVTTFDEHNIIPTTEIPPDVPRLLVVDPHHSKPTVCVWLAVQDEQLIAYRELPEHDFTKGGVPALALHDLAGTIKSLEGKEKLEWRVCDPAFGIQHAKVLGTTFKSFQEEMAEYGLYFDERVDNDVDRGIQRLRDYCKISHTTKQPRLLVMRNCPNLIRALQFWSYEERPDGALKVSEIFKDFADACRYACMYDRPLNTSKGWSYLNQDEE